MSETLATAANNVRELIRDTDIARPAVYTPTELYRTIVAHGQQLAEKGGVGRTWVSGAFTTTAGSQADVTLPSSVQYHAVYNIKNATAGWMLYKYSLDEINLWRTGIIAGTAGQGDPTGYALWEDETQLLKLRFNCIPSRAVTMDIERAALPATTYTDATVLPFADSFLRVVERSVASEIVAKLPQDELQRLRLNPAIVGAWQKFVDEGVVLEKKRMAGIVRRPFGVRAVVG